MRRTPHETILSLFTFAVTLMLAAGAAHADGWLEQPDTIPGNWDLKHDPLPPLQAILDRPRADVPVYGLYAWGGEYRRHRQSINDVGFTTIRLAGPLEDETMRALVEDGPDVLYTLGSERRDAFDSDDAFIDNYHDMIERVLGRYGPGGSYFGEHRDLPARPIVQVNIWNEPNFHYMIANDPDKSRAENEARREALYARLLPETYELIKTRWPEVTVVGFSAGGAGAGDLRWIRNLHEMEPAIALSYDVLATQPYVDPDPPEAHAGRSWGSYSIAGGLEHIRQTLTAHDRADTPIWYTEIGWAVSHDDGGHFQMQREPGRYVSPELQAAYVVRTYAWAMRLGVERVHIMFATDTDNYNAGFFLRDGSWRPSAYAVQNMINLMPQPRLIDVLSDGEDGYYAYLFSPDAQGSAPVLMAWNVAGPRTVQLDLEGLSQVAVQDMLGSERTLQVRQGLLELEIGPYPVYALIPEPGTLSRSGKPSERPR